MGTVVLHLGADVVTVAVRDRVVVYHLQYTPEGKLTAIEKIKS